jgi:hypothetical protein
MRARLRLRLVALVAAAAIALIGGPSHLVGGTLADGVCPNGTNWDNGISGCR